MSTPKRVDDEGPALALVALLGKEKALAKLGDFYCASVLRGDDDYLRYERMREIVRQMPRGQAMSAPPRRHEGAASHGPKQSAREGDGQRQVDQHAVNVMPLASLGHAP